ncbi:hypothetical protein [Halopiger goleimassiliensis]|uniref:hypothetical protein n=1 Tax=Halopiger goleimassiliensis TaxID=1293048 RepID=UPI000677BF85|nr:hypothetical protein [Halopiger goleimassiliensis]
MTFQQYVTDADWIVKFLAGALVGVGLSLLISGDPVSVPAVGSVDAVTVGLVGTAVGIALLSRTGGCNSCAEGACACGGDCQ